MSVFRQFFPQGGNHFSDPNQMPVFMCSSTSGVLALNGTGHDGATFWSNVSKCGATVDSNYTTDTYKTILSVSGGSGFVSGIIGPSTAGTSDTVTFRVTVDGVVTTIAVTADGSTRRIWLGACLDYASFTTSGKWNSPLSTDGQYASGSKRVWVLASVIMDILTTRTAFNLGSSMLRFESSLTVEIKSSAGITATANNERQSGVLYTLTS